MILLPVLPFFPVFRRAVRQGPGYAGIRWVACVMLWPAGFAPAQIMIGPNKLTKTIQGITFDSAYDNGSLANVVTGGTNIFNTTLFTETGEQGTAKYWFRFRLNGVAGRSIRLNLDHVENPQPFIRIGQGAWRRTSAAEAPAASYLLLNFTAAQDAAELAFFEPAGVTEIRQAVEERVDASGFAVTSLIGATTEGRPVEMVTVEDAFRPRAGKRRIWLHSRVHAGEVTATHSMLGFLDQVLADNETGRRLREHCLFTIVPMVNADGIARGHTRWDSLGYDPEREWCSIRLPEVAALKTRVDGFMASSNPIKVALNLHSTKGNFQDSFFFKHLAPSVTPAFETIQQNYINAVNTATPLFNNGSPQTSQLPACLFIESYFWNNWGSAVMALTHEGHFYRRQTDGAWTTAADYHEIGAALARGLLTYFPLPAASDPGLTWTSWKAGHFTPAEILLAGITPETADPDGDGICNLMEYAAGRNPRVPDAEANVIHLSALPGGGIQCFAGVSSLATDLEVFFEQSTDLSTWTRVAGSSTGLLVQSRTGRRPDDGHAIRTLNLTNTGLTGTGRIFYRLRVMRVF